MKRSSIRIALASVVLTLAATLLALNLTIGEREISTQLKRLYAAEDPQMQRSLSALLAAPLVDGNRVETLLNGEHIFPSMLEVIRSARQTITFETYIYWSGTIGQEFAKALSEKARAGVKVHVLLDWLGSVKMDQASLDDMRQAGVQIERFHQPHWLHLARFNNRTHRKLLVVDGRVGFTGGVGIADQWRGNAQDPEHWRDTHFRIEGPVVAQVQAVFMENWIKATGHVLHGDAYFPPLQPAGTQRAQMFSSSPTGGGSNMRLMYLLAITSAQRSIHLSNSYFVPDELTVAALTAALRRGVSVQILAPGGHIDTEVVRAASRSRWGPLLEAGAVIAEYEPTMFHCKVFVVDGLLSSVGSTNFDERSLSVNDEANLNVLDAAFSQRQEAVFLDDMQHARRITLQQWRDRPWQEKAMERVASLIGDQL